MNKLLTFPLCFSMLFCQGQLFSVSSDKNNVLYAGVENPLTITVQSILPKNVHVKTDNGTLSGANGHYVFYTDTGDVANFTLYKKLSNGNVKIGVSSFRVRQLPDPPVHIGNMYGGEINSSYIKAQAGIKTDVEAVYYKKGIPIVSFTLNIIRGKDYVFKEIKNEGQLFNKDVQNALSLLQNSDSVIFNNIIAIRHNGTLTILPPLTFLIKN